METVPFNSAVAIATERCPTCDQPLPSGFSRAKLEEKLRADRDREIEAQVARERRKIEAEEKAKFSRMRREIEADAMKRLVQRAKVQAKKQLAAQVDGVRDEERRKAERAIATERRRREVADRTTAQLSRQLRKLQAQLKSVSPQDRGAVAQTEVFRAIKDACPRDGVTQLAAGRRGGDVVQTVRDDQQRTCGRVLWEVKDVEDWSSDWIGKAKGDARRAGAEYVVLATSVFPPKMKTLTVHQGVIVVAPEVVGSLAAMLHIVVVREAGAKAGATDRAAKAARILDYLGSAECRSRFEAIKDAVDELTKAQQNERNYHEKHWTTETDYFMQIADSRNNIEQQLANIASEPRVKIAASG